MRFAPAPQRGENARRDVDRSAFLMLVASIAGQTACGSFHTVATSDAGALVGTDSGGAQPDTGPGGAPLDTGPACAAPCGANCCKGATACYVDSSGNHNCAPTCSSSAECPASSPCCRYPGPAGGSSICLPPLAGSVGLSPPSLEGGACLCRKNTECVQGSCAPLVNASNDPIGPYVCKVNGANAGRAYEVCSGGVGGTCSGGLCCVTLTDVGSTICELPCQNSSQCGGGQCSPLTAGACQGATGACTAPANP